MNKIIIFFTLYFLLLAMYGIIVVYLKIKSEQRKLVLARQYEEVKRIIDTIGGRQVKEFMKNDLTLEESIAKPTEEELKEGREKATAILSNLISELYSNYEFRRHDPNEGDNTSSNGLVMRISGVNEERVNKLLNLFTIYFRYKLDEKEVSEELKKELEQGKVIPTGNVVITGVNVSSPLRKADVDIIIEFMTEERSNRIERAKEKQREKLAKKGKGEASGE